MALNDTEVQRQLRQMIAFIDQEAKDKVDEIDAKAEEEFQVEKSRLVQTQRLKIMEHYSQKEKKIEQMKKNEDSQLKSAARLDILKSRTNHIGKLLVEARERLIGITKVPEKYNQCLKGMIIQGLFQLLEPEVYIKCRKVDQPLVERLLSSCQEEYTQKTGKQCNIRISSKYLSDSSAGGVELFNQNGKIKVVNTMESRLDQISEQLMPQLRQILFGPNQNRKFND